MNIKKRNSDTQIINGVKFTLKEIDVISCLFSGKPVKGMASILSVTDNTINTHLQNIMRKLNCNSRQSIIEFIEKSDQFKNIKDYYLNLLDNFNFRETLKIFMRIFNGKHIECCINYLEEYKNYSPVFEYLKTNLISAGINVKIKTHQQYIDHEVSKEHYNIWFISKSAEGLIDQEISDYSDLSFEQIMCFLNKCVDIKIALINDSIENFDQKFNHYYSFILEILKKIAIDQGLEKFVKLIDISNYSSSSFELQGPQQSSQHQIVSQTKLDIFQKNKLLIILTVGILVTIVSVILIAKLVIEDKSRAVWNLSYPNELFVGRKKFLEELHNNLKNQSIVAITGGPGFGKTQLVKKYAFDFCKEYNFIWWFDAQQDLYNQCKNLTLSVNELLPEHKRLNPLNFSKESLILKLKQIIINENFKILYIFDNIYNFEDIKDFIPYSVKNYIHVLITSRNQNVWNNCIHVGKFTRSESIDFIKKSSSSMLNQADKLATIVDDYPLALALSVSYLKNFPNLEVTDYKHFFNIDTKLENKDVILDGYHHDINKTIMTSLDYVKDHFPDSSKLIYFLSVFNNKNIPHCYVERWIKSNNLNISSIQAVKPLFDQSLISVNFLHSNFDKINMSACNNSTSTYAFHDLVHQVINASIPKDEQINILQQAIDLILEDFSGRPDVVVKKLLKEPVYLSHAIKICQTADSIKYISNTLLNLKIKILDYLMCGQRDFNKAKFFIDDIEYMLKKNIKIEKTDEALFKANKGFFEAIYNSDYNAAETLMNESFNISTEINNFNEEKLRPIMNLLQYAILQGNNKKANNLVQIGLNLLKLSESESYNALFLFSYATLLIDESKLDESLIILNRAEEYLTDVEGYLTLKSTVINRKSEALIKLKRYSEASLYIEKCYEQLCNFFQDRSDYILAKNFLLKGIIEVQYKKNYNIGIEWILKSINMDEKTFKGRDKHRNQAIEHFVLGTALEKLNQYENAFNEYLTSEVIFKKLMNNLEIDDVSLLYYHIVELSIKVNNKERGNIYIQKHIDIFGRKHHRTLKMIHMLDNT